MLLVLLIQGVVLEIFDDVDDFVVLHFERSVVLDRSQSILEFGLSLFVLLMQFIDYLALSLLELVEPLIQVLDALLVDFSLPLQELVVFLVLDHLADGLCVPFLEIDVLLRLQDGAYRHQHAVAAIIFVLIKLLD